MVDRNQEFDPISYQGPDRVYKSAPPLQSFVTATNTNAAAGDDYGGDFVDDVSDLTAIIAVIEASNNKLLIDLETDLINKYSIPIATQDTAIQTAFTSIFSQHPEVTSNYLSFYAYKYLTQIQDKNAAKFLVNFYEKASRNPGGTISLDLIKLSILISNEIIRIKEFVDEFIGELDDSSEFRVVENFQTWAEDASLFINKLRSAFEEEAAISLPSGELDAITQEAASRYQALFQIKINENVRQLKASFTVLKREYETAAEYFYTKYLGPALKYRLEVTRFILDGATGSVLGNEATQASSALNANFAVCLVDQMRRNELFKNHSLTVLNYARFIDVHNHYINQLSTKGTTVNSPFEMVSLTEDEIKFLNVIDLIADKNISVSVADNFDISHNLLDDLDADDAHSQYLLRSGGMVTGNILFEDNVRIDGIIPSKHEHNGIDGSAKINGANIIAGTISSSSIDSSALPPIPTDLEIDDLNAITVPPGIEVTNVSISFNISDPANVVGYEFELVKL